MTKDEVSAWHAQHPYGARDEAYIDAMLANVKKLWMQAPRQRLGQVLFNVSGKYDVFRVLDEEWAPR